MPDVRAVFFDVGETLVDETRLFGVWADWLGVPRHTFSTVFGAVLARGQDYRETFRQFKPGFDVDAERRMRPEPDPAEEDLYSDVRPCLQALRDRGVLVGVAGNQTGSANNALRALDLPIDVFATAENSGAEKPAAEFFRNVVERADYAPEHVLHVGDRVDMDISPARAAGLQTALLRRGPWGHIQQDESTSERCLFRLTGLSDLSNLLEHHNTSLVNAK